MLHITDDMVAEAVSIAEAQATMADAFKSFGNGRASMQERIRTEAGGIKLSTLGAVIPDQGFVGAKVYTTIAGQFSFVIMLFSTEDGRPLASLRGQCHYAVEDAGLLGPRGPSPRALRQSEPGSVRHRRSGPRPRRAVGKRLSAR